MTLDERLATLEMVSEFRQLRGPERTALASAMRKEAYWKPGFSEYAFLRISTHTIGYFSTYRVTRTSCTVH